MLERLEYFECLRAMEWVEENNSNWIDVEVSDDQLMFIWDDERLWNYRNNMQEC